MLLANRPTLLVSIILLQIVVTLFLVGWYSVRPVPAYVHHPTAGDANDATHR
jgi:hypothetical protein